jgi:hypothetical protein
MILATPAVERRDRDHWRPHRDGWTAQWRGNWEFLAVREVWARNCWASRWTQAPAGPWLHRDLPMWITIYIEFNKNNTNRNLYIFSLRGRVWILTQSRLGFTSFLGLLSSIVCYLTTLSLSRPITVTARYEAWTVFASSNVGIVGSNPIQGTDVCVCVNSVFVLSCV